DTTAPSPPAPGAPAFRPNPWGLYHTFGNVAEWARGPAGSFVRLGGHFRTEPASPLPPEPVADAASTGPDAYVGLRPVFDLSTERGAALARGALRGVAGLGGVGGAFDPGRATGTLTGRVGGAALRRRGDAPLGGLWVGGAV